MLVLTRTLIHRIGWRPSRVIPLHGDGNLLRRRPNKDALRRHCSRRHLRTRISHGGVSNAELRASMPHLLRRERHAGRDTREHRSRHHHSWASRRLRLHRQPFFSVHANAPHLLPSNMRSRHAPVVPVRWQGRPVGGLVRISNSLACRLVAHVQRWHEWTPRLDRAWPGVRGVFIRAWHSFCHPHAA